MSTILYHNGIILPMVSGEYAECLLTEDDRILFAGKKSDLPENFNLNKSELFDLGGHTLMPSFIDAHSHITSYAMSFLKPSLSEAENENDVISTIRKYIADKHIESGAWIDCADCGLDLISGAVSLAVLDAATPDNPAIIEHTSGHCGVINSKGAQMLGITAEAESFDGILIEEQYIEALKRVPMPDSGSLLDAVKKAQLSYASCGVTTVQDGMIPPDAVPLYKLFLGRNEFLLDVVGYADFASHDEVYRELSFSEADSVYHNNFRLAGYKIFLDGSPQNGTALMSEPYSDNPDNYGYSTMTDEQVCNAVAEAFRDGRQIIAHCNGDAACGQFISAVEGYYAAQSGTPEKIKAIPDIRPVMIHSQFATAGQLERASRVNIIPSFFSGHIYYYADTHIKKLGMERASKISAAGTAQRLSMCFTLHQDTPVTPPNMLKSVSCSVNRMTKGGVRLAESEKINVFDALRAVTANAAYQYHEENQKGTLEAGKLADMIVLEQNPLECHENEIENIKILNTIRHGKAII